MNHNRTSIVLLSLVLALAGLLLTALWIGMPVSHAALPQAPAAIEPSQYFPLQIGNHWVYSWTNDVYAPSPIVETMVVTEQVGSVYTLHNYYSQADSWFKISTDSGYRWIAWHTRGQNPFPLPLIHVPDYLRVPSRMLSASFEVGDNWSGTGSHAGVVCTGTTTVVTSTATIVADGYTYTSCLQIHTVVTGPHPFGAGTRDAWFAPDVGLVKLVYDHDDGSVTTAELLVLHTVFLPLTMKDSN
jgi:hypothetical protein